MKYNLRFYWPTEGLDDRGFENYSQSYARLISNVATFQLDRNLIEEHLLEVNRNDPRCTFHGGVRNTARSCPNRAARTACISTAMKCSAVG